jgi:ribosome recycling factor
MYKTFIDKADNVRTTLRLGASKANVEENQKIGKSLWDMRNIYKEMKNNFENNVKSGKMTDKEIKFTESKLKNMDDVLIKLEGSTFELRMSEKGMVEKIPVRKLIDEYNVKVEKGLDYYRKPQAIQVSDYQINPYDAGFAGKSMAVQTPTGIAGINLNPRSTVTNKAMGDIRRNVVSMTERRQEETSKEAKGKSEKATEKINKGDSKSASSGVKMPGMISIGSSKQHSSIVGFKPSASASSGGSKGESKPSASEDRSKGSGSESRSSQSSSSSSIYSLSQSGSSSSGSGSSSSSMGSKSGSSSYASFGAPFLAPGGGGGGNAGGAQRRAAGSIQNPLDELRVARASKFKRMFDFSLPNALAKQSLGNVKQTQPYGTGGAAGAYSRGASASVQEASSIISPVKSRDLTAMGVSQNIASAMAVRKSKITKPNMKSKLKKKSNGRFDLNISENLKFAKKKGSY